MIRSGQRIGVGTVEGREGVSVSVCVCVTERLRKSYVAGRL